MSRIAGSNADLAIVNFRRQAVPLLTVGAAILLDALPIVATAPIIPDFAFLVVLAWRLLRPELWRAWMALPLGFASDLLAGHPIGQSMAIWTTAFLLLDLVDSRVGWRDYWLDWLLAAVLIISHTLGGWYIARLMGSQTAFVVMAPQIVLSIFAYPLIARLVLAVDRWRLMR